MHFFDVFELSFLFHFIFFSRERELSDNQPCCNIFGTVMNSIVSDCCCCLFFYFILFFILLYELNYVMFMNQLDRQCCDICLVFRLRSYLRGLVKSLVKLFFYLFSISCIKLYPFSVCMCVRMHQCPARTGEAKELVPLEGLG